MKTIQLTRFAHTPNLTLGRMGELYTLENPWQYNARSVSCIPAGTYRCYRSHFNRGDYPTFELEDVPSRSQIVFHIGNYAKNTAGCILLGSGISVFNGEIMIVRSTDTFNTWMESMAGIDTFGLVITDIDGIT